MILPKIKVIISCTCLLLLFTSYNSSAQNYHLAQKYFTVPIIKQKSFVLLVRLKVKVPEIDTLNSFVNQIKVSTAGSTNPSEVFGIRAYCNTDSSYLYEERIFKSALFSKVEKSNADTLLL